MEVESAVEQDFDLIVDGDSAEVVQAINLFIDDVDNQVYGTSEFSFTRAGITATDIADELFDDSSYTVTSIDVAGLVAVVDVEVCCRTLVNQYDVFVQDMNDYVAAHPDWTGTARERDAVMADIYMDSFKKVGLVDIPLTVTYENTHGKWVPIEGEMDYIANTILYCS